jgi:SRSO17 transposase
LLLVGLMLYLAYEASPSHGGTGVEYRFSKTPLEGDIGDFTEPVQLLKVDETKWEPFWDGIVRDHHYLGYESVIGGRLKYLITLGARVVGAISFCSAAYKLGPRDKFIGWDEPTRLAMLPHLVCNNRFLIFPWIKVGNLASHVLSMSLKRLRTDWERQYEVEPYMVETFVDGERFLGTCYIADNWIRLGETKGYGRRGNGFVFHGRVKELYVKVLSRRFAREFHPDVDRLRGEWKELESMIKGSPMEIDEKKFDILGVAGIGPEEMEEELAAFLAPFARLLPREEAIRHFATMIKGRLAKVERKSIWHVCAATVGLGEYRNMANFMTRSPWNEDAVRAMYQKDLAEELSDPMGMLTGDGSDFPKKGNDSVGVAHQYCGRSGKLDNCQAGVFLGYASRLGYGIIDYELFMPEKWFTEKYEERREKCRVPEDLEHKTKNEILSRMINKLWASGLFKGRYVGVDAAFGHDHAFLDSLPRELVYFADVHSDDKVFLGRPEMILPPYRGRGRRPANKVPSFPARTVKDIVADESAPWNEVVVGNGSDGPIYRRDKVIRVVEVRDGGPGDDVWLYARELDDKTIRYALCDASMEATPDDIRAPAGMRWSIEQCFKECKHHLGMADYELRTWHGWRRHMLLTLIAHLFVIKLRNRFVVTPDSPGPVPVVAKPVGVAEYVEAALRLDNGQGIDHPDIRPFLTTPQPALTIGDIMTMLGGLFFLKGKFLENMKASMRSRFGAYQYTARKIVGALSKKCMPEPG